jgi:hypothetical protein
MYLYICIYIYYICICIYIDICLFVYLGCSVISVSFIICMLTLLLMPLAGLYFCVGLDFVTPSGCNLFLTSSLSSGHGNLDESIILMYSAASNVGSAADAAALLVIIYMLMCICTYGLDEHKSLFKRITTTYKNVYFMYIYI